MLPGLGVQFLGVWISSSSRWEFTEALCQQRWVLETSSKRLCVPDVRHTVMRASQMKKTTKEQFAPSRSRLLP